jgi:hypothetical protein
MDVRPSYCGRLRSTRLPSSEGSYELTSDFRNAKRDLDQELQDALQRELGFINRDFPEVTTRLKVRGHSQRAVRIEDACYGHLARTAKKYWQELLEPAPLSPQRRSELFQRAVNEAFQEIGACARQCGGYGAVESFRDKLLRRDVERKTAGEAAARSAERPRPVSNLLGEAEPAPSTLPSGARKPGRAADPVNDVHVAKLGAASWDRIEILFLSDERVQISSGTNAESRNYCELGFADRRNGKPNLAWVTLRALAEGRGIIRDGAKTGVVWPKVEKRIQEIRTVLQKHFGITEDPLPLVKGTGYRARFKIGCGPSFHT